MQGEHSPQSDDKAGGGFWNTGGNSRHTRGEAPPTKAAVDLEVGSGGEKVRIGPDYGATHLSGLNDGDASLQ
jgi:hypothetical protein